MHSISLQSSDSSIAVNDILGRIGFAASNETGSDALKVSALILAVAEGAFDANNNPTSLTFSTGHSETATEKMRIDSTGSVGIGTTYTSNGKLTVVDGENTRVSIDTGGNFGSSEIGIDFIDRHNASSQGDEGQIGAFVRSQRQGTGGSFDLILGTVHGTDLAADADEKVRITSEGKVGIATDNPATKLHIREDSSYLSENSYAIKISDGNDPETHGMLLGVDSTNNIASIQAVDPGTSWGRNLSLQVMGGNLGVGTTAPTEKLHLAGGNILLSAIAGSGGGIGKADDGLHILFPGGGTYGGGSASSVTGYIKIKLPVKSTSTMIAFDLDIYEYEDNVNGRIAKFRIAGYEYNATNWTRTQVVMDSDGPTDNKYKVTFGVDTNGDKAIWISYYSDGKDGVDQAGSSLWRYPKVSMSNLFCGHSSPVFTNWADGWDVGIVAASDIGSTYTSHVVSRSLKLYESSYDLASLTINSDYTFPTVDGSANQLLKTNGAGALSFGSVDDLLHGYPINYATSVGWVEGSGSQAGYYGGDFGRNGASAENFCEFGDFPNSMRGLIWKSRNNTTDSGADGGWTKNISGLDPEKTYISIVYVRRVGSNTSGNFYHGCRTGGTDTLEMNGNSNGNPYFHAFNIAQLPQDVWCISIGIIHAHSDPSTTSTGIGGIYRLDTGAKTGTYTNKDYRMGATTTVQNHRTFLYYDPTGNSKLDWCWPGFYDITSPVVINLLNNLLYGNASNIDISDFNASSIITESEGISSNDNDTTLPTSAAVKDYVDNNGGGSSSNLIRGSFAVTSSTTVFTVSGGYNTGSLDVYQNGIKLFKGSSYDYTETGGGTTFTLINAATSGDLIEYVAINASTNATGNTSLGSVSVTSNQTVFNTSDTFTSSNLAVFLNGVKLVDGTDYNVTSSSQFTLTSTAVSGDVVEYIAYGATVASSNLAKTGDTMTGNLTVNADLIVTGYKETHTDNGNAGTSQTIDISDSTLQTYTLTGNCTFTMPTAEEGRSFTMFLKTGAGSFVATFTNAKFARNSTPTITTDANRMDIITFYSDGTNWYGSIQQEYHI